MKVLFDYQIYNLQKYGGISRYFYELSKGLLTIGTEVDNSVILSDNVYTSDPIYASVKYHFKQNFRGKTSIYRYINRIIAKKYLTGDFDVFHPTNYETYFLKDLNKPFVITFYDLIHEKFKEQYHEYGQDVGLFARRKHLLDKCSKVIAISESTKNDIVEFYGTQPEKITVIHLSSSLGTNIKYNDNLGKYILYVGIRNSYKNFIGFVTAIASLLLKEKDLKLICAGGGSFTANEISFLSHLKIKSQVIQKPIDDQVLAGLYKNALFFVFPTMYEGFGIPVLEAFSCGCPALISNTSSLPEVGGEAALYFDPYSTDDILNKVTELFYNDSLRCDLKEKGLIQNNKFSWDKTVVEHNKLYSSVSNSIN